MHLYSPQRNAPRKSAGRMIYYYMVTVSVRICVCQNMLAVYHYDDINRIRFTRDETNIIIGKKDVGVPCEHIIDTPS